MSKALAVNATVSGRQRFFDFLYKWGMLLTVVLLVAVFGLASDNFLDPFNIINILRSIAIVTVIAIGVSISLTIGGFDLSVGSTASLANALVISLFVWHGLGTTEAILITLALCTLVGLFNAFLIVVLRIPDMLATLASLFVIQGVAMTYYRVNRMKKIALSLMTLGLLQSTAALATAPTPVPAAIAEHNGPIRIAVIRNLGSDDNTTQFVAGALQEGKKLGFKISTFLSNGDDAKFQDFVNQAISQKYDGIILSQGRDPYSTALVKKAVDAGIKVAVFDTAVSGEIPGVTVSQQDDASLTELSFGQLVKDFNGKANIVKLWVAGFPPMERRQAAYQTLLKQNPGIKELESIGAVSSDVQGDTANKVGAILAKYPKGKIDAIWGTWDAFSQGAYKALKENGRTEIKLYSIDISNQDLQLMREAGSPWKVSVAVDPKLIGATNVRLIANKIAGEPTPATYDFKAAAIPQALLAAQPGAVNVASLGKIIPGWGQTEDFIAPWFATLEAKNK